MFVVHALLCPLDGNVRDAQRVSDGLDVREDGTGTHSDDGEATVEELVAQEFCQLEAAIGVDAIDCVLEAKVAALEVARDDVRRVGGEIRHVVVGVVVEKAQQENALLTSYGAGRGR